MFQQVGRAMPSNSTIDKTKSDQLYWEYYSEQDLLASQTHTLTFFQLGNLAGGAREFSNMRRQGSFARGNQFTVVGVSFKLYNLNGTVIQWGAAGADHAPVRQFLNRANAVLRIENKEYFDFPLNNIMNVPEVAQSGTGATAQNTIAFDKDTNIYRLPKPHQITEEHSFDVKVTGTSGAFNANFGFASNQTVIRCTLHGVLVRPVQ